MRQLTDDERKALQDAKQATSDNPKPVKRVNIIFHGLMAFRNLDANYYEVLIPKTHGNCHQTKYGNPCRGGVVDFPALGGNDGPGPAYFTFEGIQPEAPQRRSFPTATNALIIKNSLVNPQYGNVKIAIRVPKPFIIRHYRGGESHLSTIASNPGTQAVLQRNPDVIHEITVFSYFAFFRPRFVGPGVDYPIPQPDPGKGVRNIGIYCQPVRCAESDSADFSAMFKLNQPAQLGEEFKIDLNADCPGVGRRIDDGPPLWTSQSVGISFGEFLALSELDDPVLQLVSALLGCQIHGSKEGPLVAETAFRRLGDVNEEGAIPGGCGAGFLCDDGQ